MVSQLCLPLALASGHAGRLGPSHPVGCPLLCRSLQADRQIQMACQPCRRLGGRCRLAGRRRLHTRGGLRRRCRLVARLLLRVLLRRPLGLLLTLLLGSNGRRLGLGLLLLSRLLLSNSSSSKRGPARLPRCLSLVVKCPAEATGKRSRGRTGTCIQPGTWMPGWFGASRHLSTRSLAPGPATPKGEEHHKQTAHTRT